MLNKLDFGGGGGGSDVWVGVYVGVSCISPRKVFSHITNEALWGGARVCLFSWYSLAGDPHWRQALRVYSTALLGSYALVYIYGLYLWNNKL